MAKKKVEKASDKAIALFEESLKSVPQNIVYMHNFSFGVSDRIYEILQERGINQKDFAQMMNKPEPEISRWLGGTHNFTLRTLANISSVLGEPLIEIPKHA